MINEQGDREYLSKELIKDIKFVIEEDQVRIYCSNTSFINAQISQFISKSDLLAAYGRIVARAKALGIGISYKQNIKKTIEERWIDYEKAFEKAKKLFGQLVAQAGVVRDRGLHMGCTYDMQLERAQEYVNALSRMTTSKSVITEFEKIRYRLDELEIMMDDFEGGESECRIIL